MVTNVGTIFLTGRKMQQKSPRRCKKNFLTLSNKRLKKSEKEVAPLPVH
jgi:hypothetical protein